MDKKEKKSQNEIISKLLVESVELLNESYSSDIDDNIYPKFIKIKQDLGKANYLREKEEFGESKSILINIKSQIDNLKKELKEYPEIPAGLINKLKNIFGKYISKYLGEINHREINFNNYKINQNIYKIKAIYDILDILYKDTNYLITKCLDKDSKKLTNSIFNNTLKSVKDINKYTKEFDEKTDFNELKKEIDKFKKIEIENSMSDIEKKFIKYKNSQKFKEPDDPHKLLKSLESDIKYIIKLIYSDPKYKKELANAYKNKEYVFTKLYCSIFDYGNKDAIFEIIDGDQDARLALSEYLYIIGEALEKVYTVSCGYGDGDEGCIYINF